MSKNRKDCFQIIAAKNLLDQEHKKRCKKLEEGSREIVNFHEIRRETIKASLFL